MNTQLKSTLDRLKNAVGGGLKSPKMLILLGMVGLGLVLISSLLSSDDNSAKVAEQKGVTVEEYRCSLQSEVERIVADITGDSSPTVVITLESGIRYSYADTTASDYSNTSSASHSSQSGNSSHSYITVRSPEGGEEALLITELMPEIRGVAIICNGGDNQATAEKIEGAVKSALGITSKRVYIAGGNSYEKR